MNHLHDLINRLRAGESERRIAQDLKVSRPTVHKYKEWAAEQGYLDADRPLPDLATLLAGLGPVRQPPQMTSSLAPYQAVVEQLLVGRLVCRSPFVQDSLTGANRVTNTSARAA